MNARMALLLLSGGLALAHPLQAQAETPCPPQPCCPAPACPAAAAAGGSGLELDADFLLWWVKATPTPPLATTSAPADLGLLGTPTASILLGGRNYTTNPLAGGRFAARYLLNESLGLQVGGFFLENGSFARGVGGLDVLSVPVLDPNDNSNAVIRLAGPGLNTGRTSLSLSHRLWSMDIAGLGRVQLAEGFNLDVLAGFRYLQLAETLNFATSTAIAAPGFFAGTTTPAGSIYSGYDQFGTRNNFYGGVIGLRAVGVLGAFTTQVTGSVALGANQQTVTINGSTTLNAPGQAPATASGNIFTQTTNIGRRTYNRFAVVPQAGLSVGCQMCEWARMSVGYDFLYISDVARPGDQIDRGVNPNLPPILDDGTRGGPARPAATWNGTDYWAQGISFGLELAF